jgi:hypothetical protein
MKLKPKTNPPQRGVFFLVLSQISSLGRIKNLSRKDWKPLKEGLKTFLGRIGNLPRKDWEPPLRGF